MCIRDSFKVQVSPLPRFDVNVREFIVASPAVEVDMSGFTGKFYWRVCSTDKAGNTSAWTEARWFDISSASPAPAVPSETRVRAGDTISWLTVEGAVEYIVQIATDRGFANIVFERTTADNSLRVPELAREGRYYWRVAGRDAVGNLGAFSEVSSFIVQAPEEPEPDQTILYVVAAIVVTALAAAWYLGARWAMLRASRASKERSEPEGGGDAT